MNFFKRLASLFAGKPSSGGGRLLPIYVLSTRCHEPLMGQVDLFNELSQTEEGDYPLYTRKVLHTSGERRCFAQVEVHLWFDQNKQLMHHEVEGGRWLEADEYQAELARFHAPPEEEAPTAAGETPTDPAPGTPGPEKDSDHA
jgi:hypothetical protein